MKNPFQGGRCSLLTFFLCLLIAPVMAATTDVFPISDQSITEQVELFQFDSDELRQRSYTLAKALRCPQCQNQNLVESNSPIALDLRLIVFNMINSGASDQEVIEYMTSRYGEFVLYNPAFRIGNGLLWGGPIVLLVLFLFFSWRSIRYTHST